MDLFKDYWKEYASRYPDCDINKDGIVDYQEYLKEDIKVLLFLKETNSLARSLIEFLKEGAAGGGCYTWTPICKWIVALLDGIIGNFGDPQKRSKILCRIATINLKKTPGTSCSSHSYISFAEENKDLLAEQIKNIPYDLIILCCDKAGKEFILNELIPVTSNWIKVDDRLEFAYTKDQKMIIKARHPNRASRKYIDSFLKIHEIL